MWATWSVSRTLPRVLKPRTQARTQVSSPAKSSLGSQNIVIRDPTGGSALTLTLEDITNKAIIPYYHSHAASFVKPHCYLERWDGEPSMYLWCYAWAQICTDPWDEWKTEVASRMCLAPYWWPCAISLNATTAWQLNSISSIQPQRSDKEKVRPGLRSPCQKLWDQDWNLNVGPELCNLCLALSPWRC